jgi:hypothetical protein
VVAADGISIGTVAVAFPSCAEIPGAGSDGWLGFGSGDGTGEVTPVAKVAGPVELLLSAFLGGTPCAAGTFTAGFIGSFGLAVMKPLDPLVWFFATCGAVEKLCAAARVEANPPRWDGTGAAASIADAPFGLV